MSQHDFDITNQTASNTRIDINLALKALASLSSATSEPSPTYANMLWYDTENNTLKMRSEDNDFWIRIGYFDQSAFTMRLFEFTEIVDSSGVKVGELSRLATSAWETGTNTTEALVSPAKVKAAIEALTPDAISPIGDSQSWANVSRTSGVSYQNTTGRSVQICAVLSGYAGPSPDFIPQSTTLQVSTNGSTWVALAQTLAGASSRVSVSAVMPNNHYYRFIGSDGNGNGSATFSLLS